MCASSRDAVAPRRAPGAGLRREPPRDRLLRGPHRAAHVGRGRAPRGPDGERGQGDAARGLPAPPRAAGAAPARRRPRAAQADGVLVGQRRRVAGARHRGQRRARAARPRGRPALVRAGAAVGHVAPRRRRRRALLPPPAAPRAAPSPRHGAAPAALDRAVAALGHRARAPAGLGALLQGRLGVGLGGGGPPGRPAPPRAPALVGGHPHHGQPQPRLRGADAARRRRQAPAPHAAELAAEAPPAPGI